MKPDTSVLNLMPSSTAPVSFALGVPGTGGFEVLQTEQGHVVNVNGALPVAGNVAELFDASVEVTV